MNPQVKTTKELHQMRCGNCNKLLAKAEAQVMIQIKCPRCKTLNQKTNS